MRSMEPPGAAADVNKLPVTACNRLDAACGMAGSAIPWHFRRLDWRISMNLATNSSSLWPGNKSG